MARRNDHSRSEIHQMALEAARAIVREEGLSGLSVRKIATRIGYTGGTLYLVFRNLDDLILQLNAQTLEQLHTCLVSALQGCQGVEQCLLALARGYVRFAHDERPLWDALYSVRLAADEALPEGYQARVDALFGLVEQALAPLHGAEQRRLASHVLWGGIHGITRLALDDKLDLAGPTRPEALTESLVVNYLRGLAAG